MIALPPDWLTAYGSTAADLAVAGAGALRWRRLSRGSRWATVWLLASGTADICCLAWGRIWHTSRPPARVWYLVAVCLALESLGAFQNSAQRKAIFRTATAGFAIVWGFFLLTFEPMAQFSPITAPLHGMVILIAASATVLRRTALARRDLFHDAGFLTSSALIGYAILETVKPLVAQLAVNTAPIVSVTYTASSNALLILIDLLFLRSFFVSSTFTSEPAT